MASKFLNISTDNTLGGVSPSDEVVSSQKAIKTYVDSQTGTAPAFVNIIGQPSDNANLATALNAKYDASNPNGYTSNVGTVTSVNNTSPDGSGNVTITIPNPLPSQTGQSGKYLTTDGTDASWADVDTLPSQTGQNGKFLSTDGTNPSWQNVDALPSQTGQSGKFLTTDGTDASWATVPTRNIGQIIQSTVPLTDAGLHLLDGSLISGSGSYADFVTYVAGLVSTCPDIFETEANWQSAVTTYGVCGKYVYDSVNNTVRLPKITGFTEGTIDATVLGDLVEAGLPNITGKGGVDTNTNETGSYWGGCLQSTSSGKEGVPGDGTSSTFFTFDASRSSSIYGNSSTVQPQAIKVLYYIVIATSTKTNIEVDIDEIMTDLNGKVDSSDLSTIYPVVETYVNGTNWYRVYSDGWVEQGGKSSSGTSVTVNFLKNFSGTSFTIIGIKNRSAASGNPVSVSAVTTASATFATSGDGAPVYWEAKGYGA